MRHYYLLVLILCLHLPNGESAYAQTAGEVCYNPNLVKDTTKKSIKSMAVGLIGGDSIKISYHSPGVRKRVIWGGLVPYDEVWVTGAHDATTIEIDKPFFVDGKEVPPGKYALFTIPGQKEWIVIINKHWKQHLASEYDEKEHVLRIKVKPVAHPHTERLQYFIEPAKGNAGKISMAWEKVRIEFSVTIKN
ncbi:MAG: DUF2911 domain-containing protein [Chitinophagaceae bacterium]|nr:DUF2911 domain-containing protein [Chitinophagaceae bacterium]